MSDFKRLKTSYIQQKFFLSVTRVFLFQMINVDIDQSMHKFA